MSAKTYIPFAILGMLLATAALMLFAVLMSLEKLILFLLVSSVSLAFLLAGEKRAGFVIRTSLLIFLSSSLLLFLVMAVVISSFKLGT